MGRYCMPLDKGRIREVKCLAFTILVTQLV